MSRRPVSRRAVLAAGGSAALAAAAAPAGASAASPATASAAPTAPAWQSSLVRRGGDGRLVYHPDPDGHRLPDFSHAGYRNGTAPLPRLPVVATIGPVSGDNTAHIQAALDSVAALPRERRGALLLRPGTYPVAGTLRVTASGTVLRGSGDGDDPSGNTVIRATGNTPADRNVIEVGGTAPNGWAGEVAGTRTDITTDVVEVGDRTVRVADPSAVRPGANVILHHPCTEAWLAAVDHGGTDVDGPWKPGEHPLVYNRHVVRVDGDRVELDAPVFNRLDRSLAQSYLYTWDRAGLVTEVGVEDLRVDIEYRGAPDQDQDHARSAIRVQCAQDAWVRDCTALHFVHAGVETLEATRVTVADCRALDPVSVITGGNRYNFNTFNHSQLVLFTDCTATGARHAFISNGTSTVSGIVFLRGVSEGSLATSEGHRRWTQAMLFDGHREVGPRTSIPLALYNRGSYGTGHGWAAAFSVAWNCDTAGRKLVVQKPPTSQNYAIGCRGEVSGAGPFPAATGHIEGTGETGLWPPSLFEAQLRDRVGD